MKKFGLAFLIALLCLSGCTSKKNNTRKPVTFYDGIYKFYSATFKYENLQEREQQRVEFEEYKQEFPEDYPGTFDDYYPISYWIKAGKETKQEGHNAYVPESFIDCTISSSVFKMHIRPSYIGEDDDEIVVEGLFTYDKSNFIIEFSNDVEIFNGKVKTFVGYGYIQNDYQYIQSKVYLGTGYSQDYIFRKVV